MEYCNSYNGMAYHHSQQHSHEFRCGMKVGYNNSYNNLYGHSQHSWNGMHHNHHINSHHHQQQQQQHHHPLHPSHPQQQQPPPPPPPPPPSHHSPYGNRNIYDSYKANLAQNCFQSSNYSATNFDSPYEPTTNATVPPTAMYRLRFGGGGAGAGYQMCDVQQCFPGNGADSSRHTEYMAGVNGGMSRCIDPLANGNFGAADPRNHHQSYSSGNGAGGNVGGGHDAHHSHSMRIPTNHRPYESHHQKPSRSFDSDPSHQSWYGHGHSHNNNNNNNNTNNNNHNSNNNNNHSANTSETINETNQHYYQYHHHHHHHTINNANYNEYPHHMHNTNENQYTAGASNGQLVTAKEDKAPKMHRDRSLSKLVAMNRRLETQMNESERMDSLHHEHFENFDYYTDYSETPDSITSSSQYTNNDCLMNNTSDTDNNNNVNGTLNNIHKNNCKEANNQQVTNDSDWLSISATETATTTPQPPPTTTITTTTSSPSPSSSSTPTEATSTLTPTPTSQSDACIESQADNSSSKPSVSSDEHVTKKSDLPSTTTKSPAKHNTNKKIIKSKKVTNENLMGKRRKRREKKSNTEFSQIRGLKADTIPLPGFQQAFGSTEIGRFSEIFFNASGSPIEIGLFESEADTLSPQPWEMGDSLEGPHFGMQPNGTPLSYAESLGSTDSPTASNNSFFGELRASEF